MHHSLALYLSISSYSLLGRIHTSLENPKSPDSLDFYGALVRKSATLCSVCFASRISYDLE